jgi:hypothetical protein
MNPWEPSKPNASPKTLVGRICRAPTAGTARPQSSRARVGVQGGNVNKSAPEMPCATLGPTNSPQPCNEMLVSAAEEAQQLQ